MAEWWLHTFSRWFYYHFDHKPTDSLAVFVSRKNGHITFFRDVRLSSFLSSQLCLRGCCFFFDFMLFHSLKHLTWHFCFYMHAKCALIAKIVIISHNLCILSPLLRNHCEDVFRKPSCSYSICYNAAFEANRPIFFFWVFPPIPVTNSNSPMPRTHLWTRIGLHKCSHGLTITSSFTTVVQHLCFRHYGSTLALEKQENKHDLFA